jgi:hypothetical protein
MVEKGHPAEAGALLRFGNLPWMGKFMRGCAQWAVVRMTLGVVSCFAIFASGCTGKVGEVREVGSGVYSIDVRSTGGFLDSSASQKAMFATVDKAGEYCRSKGLKLAEVRSGDNNITFQCISGYPKAHKDESDAPR